MSDTDDCKRPWDDGADYYSTSDQDERLTHETLDECLEEHLTYTGCTVEEAISQDATIYAWRRDSINSEDEAKDRLDNMVERLAEEIGEEYGDPDGGKDTLSTEAEKAFKIAVLPALRTLLSTVTPWQCSVVGKRTFTADELLAWSTFDELGTGYIARAEKAERERDEARVLVAELVTALEACTEWMGDNVPSDGWGCRDRRADADRIETLKTANAALDKAKEAKL